MFVFNTNTLLHYTVAIDSRARLNIILKTGVSRNMGYCTISSKKEEEVD